MRLNPFKQRPVATMAQLLELGHSHPNTPDYWAMELSEFQLVFVADEMMKGHRAHDLVENDSCSMYGVCYTQQPFAMLKKLIGKATYPVILKPQVGQGGLIGRTEAAPIKGELYFVTPKQLVELDKFKNNGVEFIRERVFLDIPFRPVVEHRRDNKNVHVLGLWQHEREQDAWMYIANAEYWTWTNYADKTLSPVKMVRPSDYNEPPYYHYTAKEDAK